MNGCIYQQKALVGCVVGVVETMMRRDMSVSNGVLCPKPRRVGFFNSASGHAHELIGASRLLQINNQETEACDLKAGTELLDIILTKGMYDVEESNFEVASSPPFFCGSPPSRASNPLIQDAHFGNDNFVRMPPIPEAAAAPASPPSFSTSSRMNGGGCVRVKFGNKPAPVRIEGFNIRSSCSISAVA